VVVVPALVRSGSGDLISDLATSDFLIADNGIEQKLSLESVFDQPLALVIVMQTGGAAPPQFQTYRTFQKLFSAMLAPSVAGIVANPTHPIALITFDSRLQQIWNFPPRIDGVKASFARPDSGDHGAAVLDALNGALALLEQQPPRFRRVVLLLSQSADQGSSTAADKVVQRLARSNTTVYSMTFGPGADKVESSNLTRVARAMQENTAAEAAFLSGGESVRLKNKDDLVRCLAILADDFHHAYVLHFRPDSPDSGFHSLSVRLAGKHSREFRVAARSAYWVADAR